MLEVLLFLFPVTVPLFLVALVSGSIDRTEAGLAEGAFRRKVKRGWSKVKSALVYILVP